MSKNTSKHVLVVEDQQAEIVLIGALFKEFHLSPEQYTITVSFAKTLAVARELISKIQFDLIFLDGDLSGKGMSEQPDTLPLFLEIGQAYRKKVFCTTGSERYQRIMAEHGCPHVAKENIASFATQYLQSPPPAYDIAVGKLLVIQLTTSLQVYVGIITNTSPLTVKAHDSLVPFTEMHRDLFSILEDETVMIQGTPEEQAALLKHYATKMKEIIINVSDIKKQLATALA